MSLVVEALPCRSSAVESFNTHKLTREGPQDTGFRHLEALSRRDGPASLWAVMSGAAAPPSFGWQPQRWDGKSWTGSLGRKALDLGRSLQIANVPAFHIFQDGGRVTDAGLPERRKERTTPLRRLASWVAPPSLQTLQTWGFLTPHQNITHHIAATIVTTTTCFTGAPAFVEQGNC